MANRHYISYPVTRGRTSRQAHADLPAGTYERELGKEGFFGPATHMYHSHPPTGWIDWEGPLRPRCFDFNRLRADRLRPGTPRSAAQRQRQAQLLAGADPDGPPGAQRRRRPAALRPRGRRRPLLRLRSPRVPERRLHRAAARHHVADRVRDAGRALLIEATGGSCAARQGPGRPARDLRPGDARRAADRRGVPRPAGRGRNQGADQAARCDQYRDLSVQSARRGRLAGRPLRLPDQRARHPARDEPSLPPAALGAHHLRRRASWSAPSARGRSRPIPAR